MAKKIDKIYCVYCGEKNNCTSNRCINCYKKLDPKNQPFKDYIKDKIEDKIKGDIQDNIFSLITGFIKTHLYGTIFTCSVIFCAVSVVLNVSNNSIQFDKVSSRPIVEEKILYLGKGKTATEVMIGYVEALNEKNSSNIKSYELSQFYPEIYDELISKNASSNYYPFFSNNVLLDNKDYLLGNDLGFYIGSNLGVNGLNLKYGDYNAIRHSVLITYCCGNPCQAAGHYFNVSFVVELIEVNGNYYVSGTDVEEDSYNDISNKVAFDYLMKYKGDTRMFTREDLVNASKK